jgi:hypothetical protein
MSDEYTWVSDNALPAVEELQFSTSESTSENYQIDEDTNIVLTEVDEGEEIQLSFTLVKNAHPENESVEDQRDNLKSLVSNDAVENPFKFADKEGHLSVETVDIPESGDVSNLRRGEIQSTFLPWPKHFPDNKPAFQKGVFDEIQYDFSVEGSFGRIQYLSDGEILYELSIGGEAEKVRPEFLTSDISKELFVEGFISRQVNALANIYNELDIEVKPNLLRSIEKDFLFKLNLKSSNGFGRDFGRSFGQASDVFLNRQSSVQSSVDYSLNTGQTGFGTTFGEDFSEEERDVELSYIPDMTGYGSHFYGSGRYGIPPEFDVTGSINYSIITSASLSLIESLLGNINYSLGVSGDVDVYRKLEGSYSLSLLAGKTGFGTTFGGSFSERKDIVVEVFVNEYGSLSYGRSIYG